MKKLFLYLFILVIVLGVSAFLYADYLINQKIPNTAPVKIIIPKGAGTKKIIEILNAENIAHPSWLFEIYAKYMSLMEKKYLQAGVYRFPPELTTSELIESLFQGKYLYIARVTFPEGISYKEFASILQKEALVDSSEFVRLAVSDSLLRARKISAKSIEGYLLPDTYDIYMESDAKDILNKLLNAHEKIFSRINSQSSNKKGLNKTEALTLASIVEAETPDDDERSKVAGLYLNRLKKNMLLQADPTVAYSLGGKKKLSYDDLKNDNAYNTYKYPGLPPGPINNPGTKSIRAALNPELHDYLYMVSIGDGSQRHNFAKTYSEHLKFVAEYRRRLGAQN